MTNNTKSSITLPPDELKLVKTLQARLRAKSKVEVVRRGLRLLQDATDRAHLRREFAAASNATRGHIARELAELDGVADDGIDDA